MLVAPLPENEPSRLESLRRMALLSTPDEAEFDRITRTAAKLFDMPIALVSLLDENRQWFKSCVGLDVRETPREISFCGHAIMNARATFVVRDSLADPRFADNPLVTGAPHVRFYAGVPLRNPEGNAVGTLCLIDTKPRVFDDADVRTLEDFALMAERALAARTLSRAQHRLIDELDTERREGWIDPSLRVWNCEGITRIFEREVFDSQARGTTVSLLVVHADVNADDAAARAVADVLRAMLRSSDALGHLDGGDFLVIMPGSLAYDARAAAERMRMAVSRAKIPLQVGAGTLTLGVGCASIRDGDTAGALLERARDALGQAKSLGHDRVVTSAKPDAT